MPIYIAITIIIFVLDFGSEANLSYIFIIE